MAGTLQSLGPEGLLSGPTPRRQKDVFQSWVGCTDTEGLFACCPHWLGIACMTGHPGAATYVLPVPVAPPPLPCLYPCISGGSFKCPKGQGPLGGDPGGRIGKDKSELEPMDFTRPGKQSP